MGIVQIIVNFVSNILAQAPIMIGLVAALGLLLQKKSFDKVVKGTFKAGMGIIIILQSVSIIMSSMTPLTVLFDSLFNSAGKERIEIALSSDFFAVNGQAIGLLMLVGLVCNVLIAKFTKYKALHMHGDNFTWFPTMILGVAVTAGIDGPMKYIFAGVWSILFFTVVPNLMVKPVERLIGSRQFTIAHTAAPFCLLGDFVGRQFGKIEKNKENNCENLKLPKQVSFLKDTTITASIFLMLMYLVVGIYAGAEARNAAFGGQGLVVGSFLSGLLFGGGLVIMLNGVRLVISELLPAFKGISTKLVPGAIPGMDIPLIFPYGPTALTIGFVISLLVSTVTLLLINAANILPFALLPVVLTCYFDVAPGCIFANKHGGLPAVITTAVIGGVAMMVIVALAVPFAFDTVGSDVWYYGGNLYGLHAIFEGLTAKVFTMF